MKDLSKEVFAYALQNAIEFGEAKTDKILPKLFQHGLKKENIPELLPIIDDAVKRINALTPDERKSSFAKLESFVAKRSEKTKDLDELPGSGLKGKMVFRLAPFPSGALHLGNAKTYLLNAIYAERYKGKVLLVMDDTIGSSEKPLIKESYDLIEEAFKWLSVKYKKPVIYKSDRLKIYYKYAEELIKKGKAYVCHCPQEELRDNRANGVECGCRQFPNGIQKLRWKEMFNEKEGGAVLRIKTSMQHPNPAFRDRVLFKISDREHPRVGKKYRVWPSLEMSWAIDDHLLGITHIIRGNDLMIETDMERYIWDIFKWKYPETIHTGMVRIEGMGAKLSKSKAQKEVLSGEFVGWDDPRTWSMQSLSRRGIRAEAIREFVKEIGLNKQDISVPVDSLYAINRKLIDAESLRYSFIQNPIKIQVDDPLRINEIEVPVHPDYPQKTRKIKVGRNIYISEKDYSELKGKEARLIHLFNVVINNKTKVTSVENKSIPKINWISESLKARILMPDGEWIEGIADEGIKSLKKGQVIQFERTGFARYDGCIKGIYEFWFAHR